MGSRVLLGLFRRSTILMTAGPPCIARAVRSGSRNPYLVLTANQAAGKRQRVGIG